MQDDEAGMVDALAGEGKEQEEGEQKSSPASNDGPAYPSSPSSLSSPPPRAASPAQWPSTPTQPPAHPQPPLLQTSSPPPTPSAATPTATSYYDCPGTDGLEEGDDDDDDASGFATPLGSSSAHTLRRSSSAFSLSARSLTGSPLRLASALRGEAAAPQEEEETKGEGARTSSTPPPPTPVDAPDDDDDDGRRDMHEVVCASQRLSEAAIHMRFAGLRAAGASAGGGAAGLIEVENGGVLGAGGDASSSMCRHLAIIALRPDAVAGAVTTALVEVARAQGLLIAKRQGPHVVAEMAPSGPGRWEWAQVDMQLCVDRQARDRVLLVRFLLAPGAGGSEDAPPGAAGPSSSSLSSSHHGGGRGEEEEAAAARRRRPATRAFLEALRRRLVELGLNRHGACMCVRVGVRFDHRR